MSSSTPKDAGTGLDSGTQAESDEAKARQALATRVLSTVEPIARRSSAFIGFFGLAAALSLLSGVSLVMLIYLPVSPSAPGKLLAAALTLVVLSLPGCVLLIFRVGLQQIAALPKRLAATSAGITTTSRETYRAVASPSDGRISRLLKLLQGLAHARSLLAESRDLIVTSTAAVRIANPIVLLTVLVSLVLSAVLILIAAIAGAVSVL